MWREGLQGGIQGGTTGAMASGGNPYATAGGALLGAGLGILGGGKRRRYGPSEAEIAEQAGAHRAVTDRMQTQMLDRILGRSEQSAASRGLGMSGAVAQGVPDFHESLGLQGLQREADIADMGARARASRVYDYEPGMAETLGPALMGAAGQYAQTQMHGEEMDVLRGMGTPRRRGVNYGGGSDRARAWAAGGL